tara:strand:- start:1084 stop:1572 length:489 start_codon:yes stop_codon:yes gene_type:complete
MSSRIEVERAIAATPAEVFDVVSDPSGHVAIDASGMLMSATGARPTGVGDRFEVQMDRDSLRDMDLGEYKVTVVIETFVQDTEIAWSIDGVMQPPIGHIYGYRLQEIEGGTLVVSYYDWSNTHPQHAELVESRFPIISESHLLATLGILARTVAPGKRRPLV